MSTPPPADYAEQRKRLFEDKKTVTGRISETCRYIDFGLLAVFYSVCTAAEGNAHAMVRQSRGLLTVMALAAALSLVCDYLQYVFGRRATNLALDTANQQYNRRWPSYRLRGYFFQAKQILMFAGAAVLIFVMIRYLALLD